MQQLLGSGKTAVLVERIIQKILKEKIDVDKILVVTFTNAAASEMRERILEAIYKKLDENPNDAHLQKQIILLNRANISTIHSFCLDIIKNNFYEIDISPNFRIADSTEVELLKIEAIEDTLEEFYDNKENEFLKIIDMYAGYRGDEELKEMILKIYKYIQSMPYPYKWLQEKIEYFNLDENIDFAETIWGEILIGDLKQSLTEAIDQLNHIYSKVAKDIELSKYASVILEDINIYERLINSLKSWDDIYSYLNKINYSKWPVDRKIISELKEQAKQIRDKVKKEISVKFEKFSSYSSEEAKTDIKNMYTTLKELEKIIIAFGEKFSQKKAEKNCIDFNDIEHYTLNILEKNEEVAKKYREKFKEIAIDEYQDSNMVQEHILNTVSRGNNIFMVGDVKQSIYKFRQARPELFIEKYENYSFKEESKENEDIKIQLFRNFRSRKNILDLTNLVFDTIMSKKLGDIDYTEKEYLLQDKDYDLPQADITNYAGKAELHIIDLGQTDEDEDLEEKIENTEIEAKWVANKIKDILKSNYFIYDKKQKKYRKATYKDIVILLRTTSNIAPIYEKAITDLEMPVFTDASSEYLNSIEIQTVISVLKILDNPLQDIPLVSVLRSYIGGFTDNELIQIRLLEKNDYYYNALKKGQVELSGDLQIKIVNFFGLISKWKKEQEYLTLEELIWNIYMDSGYYQYVSLMPNGNIRIANLKMLLERAKEYETISFKGLFNFMRFIDKLKSNSGDMEAAKIIGENENVIRIMSIHKSKGLEFPIVFLSGTGKKFNIQDLNDKLLLHNELGFGPNYIDIENGIEFSTLAKEAIKLIELREIIAEEMRVLYVALTRSREKLIITGIDKDYEKSINKKQELINIFGRINESLLIQNKSFLSWLELISIEKQEKLKDIMEVYTHSKADVLKNSNKKEEVIKEDFFNILRADNKISKDVELLLNWKYKYEIATKIQSKTSITKIKEKSMDKEENFEISIPAFLKETNKLTGAQKGSAMHLVLQKLDFTKNYDKNSLKDEIEKLVLNNILTKNEADSISVYKIMKFLESDLAKQINMAKEVHKETPFYINLTAEEAFDKNINESVLTQGIIDLYFINKDGDIILLDYKTDFVEEGNEEELVNKYKTQLYYYKKAIEEATNRKVKEVYIYSIYLDKEIMVNC